jgi:virulence-associated protein VapD
MLAQSASGSLALPLTIISVTNRADNALGAYSDVQVIFNRHQFKQAQGTA